MLHATSLTVSLLVLDLSSQSSTGHVIMVKEEDSLELPTYKITSPRFLEKAVDEFTRGTQIKLSVNQLSSLFLMVDRSGYKRWMLGTTLTPQKDQSDNILCNPYMWVTTRSLENDFRYTSSSVVKALTYIRNYHGHNNHRYSIFDQWKQNLQNSLSR